MLDASTSGPVPRAGYRLAVASLICGILGLLCFLPAAIAAIIMGTTALSRIKQAPGRGLGVGMARAARGMGILGVVLFLMALIALPNLLRSRLAAGESSPVGNMRTINTAAATYASIYPKIGYPPSLEALGGAGEGSSAAGLIDSYLASGTKSGYRFRYTPVAPQDGGSVIAYTIHADPLPVEKPNWLDRLFRVKREEPQRHLFSNQTGVIRYEIGREAGPESPTID